MQEDKKKPNTSHSTSHLVIPESEQTDVETAESAQPATSGKPELGNWKWSEDTPAEEKEIHSVTPSSDLVETGTEATGTKTDSPAVSTVEPTGDHEPKETEPSAEGKETTPSASEEGEERTDSISQQQVDPKVIEEAAREDEQDEQADEWDEDDEPVRRPVGKLKWSQNDEAPLDSTAPVAVAAETVQDAPSSTPEQSQSSAGKVEDDPKDQSKDEPKGTSPKRGSGAKWFKRTLLFLPLVWIIVLAVGLMIGYGVMGDQPPGEVFNPDLWKHLYDLIYG
jgi:hypothetical protein